MNSKKKRLLILMSIVGGVILLSNYLGFRRFFQIEFIKDVFSGNILLASLLYIILFSIGNILYVPGGVFLFGAILALGKIHGGMLTFVAALISCSVSFFIVGKLGEDALREFENKRIAKKIFSKLDSNPFLSIFLLRAIFQTMPVLNYSLALSRVRFRDYFFASFFGLPIPITIYCLFFDYFISKIS